MSRMQRGKEIWKERERGKGKEKEEGNSGAGTREKRGRGKDGVRRVSKVMRAGMRKGKDVSGLEDRVRRRIEEGGNGWKEGGKKTGCGGREVRKLGVAGRRKGKRR